MDPVAQGLAVHSADLRRRAAVHSVPDSSKREKPTALVDVFDPARQRSKRLRRIVFPQSHRCWHGANPPAPIEPENPAQANPK
jgi:hypothetical protein